MTFRDWIFSNHPANDGYNGQWQFPHILTLCLCIAIILALTFIFRKKDQNTRNNVLRIVALCVLFFELARRIINIIKGNIVDFDSFLYVLLPRPWCAISCWLLILAGIFNKKTFWNFASINALLCAVIFFVAEHQQNGIVCQFFFSAQFLDFSRLCYSRSMCFGYDGFMDKLLFFRR